MRSVHSLTTAPLTNANTGDKTPYRKHIYGLFMSNTLRKLCLEYLVWNYGVSMTEAKLQYAAAPRQERLKLFDVATDWHRRGRLPKGLETIHPPLQPPVTTSAPSRVEPPSKAPSKAGRQKKVMYSILLPPTDLDALRGLSERSDETVAHHVRTAIKRYLKEEGTKA